MRNLIFAINISLDGCCDHDKFNPDEETLNYFTQLTYSADTFVYGRKTYQLMVPYWPEMAESHSGSKTDNDFADAFNSVNKIVVCARSLAVKGGKTKIVRTNLEEEILKLKQEPGQNILTGGVSIPSQLMELGLIDEYHFVVHPILAGTGRRLFEGESIGLPEHLQLKLVETKVFKSGVVLLRYLKQ